MKKLNNDAEYEYKYITFSITTIKKAIRCSV